MIQLENVDMFKVKPVIDKITMKPKSFKEFKQWRAIIYLVNHAILRIRQLEISKIDTLIVSREIQWKLIQQNLGFADSICLLAHKNRYENQSLRSNKMCCTMSVAKS